MGLQGSDHHKFITAIGREASHFLTWSHELSGSTVKQLHGSQHQQLIFFMHFLALSSGACTKNSPVNSSQNTWSIWKPSNYLGTVSQGILEAKDTKQWWNKKLGSQCLLPGQFKHSREGHRDQLEIFYPPAEWAGCCILEGVREYALNIPLPYL